MTHRLILSFVLLLDFNANAQLYCDSLRYNADSLLTLDGKVFTGQCISVTKKHVIKSHINEGFEDSLAFSDKKGRLQSAETFCNERSTYRRFYKTGGLRQCIGFKNDAYFGFWREYYENGKIKYEAEYGDSSKIKNDTYYTWDKKGQKYMHTYVETVREKRRGKLLFQSSFGRNKKIKIKNDT